MNSDALEVAGRAAARAPAARRLRGRPAGGGDGGRARRGDDADGDSDYPTAPPASGRTPAVPRSALLGRAPPAAPTTPWTGRGPKGTGRGPEGTGRGLKGTSR